MKTTLVSSPAFELLADLEPNTLGYHLSLSTRIPVANHPTAIPKLQVNLSGAELVHLAAWLQEAVAAFGLAGGAGTSLIPVDPTRLYWFEVDEFETLMPYGHKDPETRRELLDFSASPGESNSSLLYALDSEELSSQWAVIRAHDSARQYLGEMKSLTRRLTPAERAHVKSAHEVIESGGETWRDYIRFLDEDERDEWIEEFEAWLDDGPDIEEWEHLPDHATGQGLAFRYFEDMPLKQLEAIGVVTIEGDRPGSSYIAAELRIPPEQANAAAERLGLDCRFCRPGDRITGDGRIAA